MTKMIYGFQSHSSCQAAIANDGDHLVFLLKMISCQRHTNSERDRCRTVSGKKRIMFAFERIDKTAQSFVLPQSVKLMAATCQHLVHVALVTDIPEDLVFRGLEDVVERQGNLDNAKIGG